jgi:hypothetical protein
MSVEELLLGGCVTVPRRPEQLPLSQAAVALGGHRAGLSPSVARHAPQELKTSRAQ